MLSFTSNVWHVSVCYAHWRREANKRPTGNSKSQKRGTQKWDRLRPKTCPVQIALFTWWEAIFPVAGIGPTFVIIFGPQMVHKLCPRYPRFAHLVRPEEANVVSVQPES